MKPHGFPQTIGRPLGLARVLRFAFWAAVVVGLLYLSGLIAIPSAATTQESNFTAVEDTYIKITSPDRNYGDRSTLEADNNSIKRILLRFQVTGIPEGASIASATLRLFVVDSSSESGTAHAVGGGWSEATTTWSNAPPVGPEVADLLSPASVGTWVEVDVTSATGGNGDVDFYIVTPSNNGVDYSSSEAGSNPPTLILLWSPIATATPTATANATAPATQIGLQPTRSIHRPTRSRISSVPTMPMLMIRPNTSTPCPTYSMYCPRWN